MKAWEHYLLGVPFEWHSNHKNLLYWTEEHNLERRQKRMGDRINMYNFTVHHKPGTAMTQTDAISRKEEFQVTATQDNRNIAILDKARIRTITEGKEHVNIIPDANLLQWIKTSKQWDDNIRESIETLKNMPTTHMKKPLQDWDTQDDLILYKGHIYVPNDVTL